MTPDDAPDPIRSMLASLPPIAPTAARDGRVRARCHDALTRRTARQQRADRRHRASGRLLDAALVLGVSLYGAAAVAEAVRLIAR